MHSINQIGIGNKYGSYAMVEANKRFRRYAMQHSFQSILQKDIKNCFNNLDRQMAIDIIKTKCPSIYPFIHSMYGIASYVVLGNGHHFKFKNGFHQGRKSSGIILGLVQKVVEDEVRTICMKKINDIPHDNESYKLHGNTFYLDDDSQLASLDYQFLYLNTYITVGRKYGVELNLNEKTKLYYNKKHHKYVQKMLQKYRHLKNIECHTDFNINVLNIPIGEQNYIDEVMNKKINKWEYILKQIDKMNSIQIKLRLLRKFYNINKVQYFIQNIDFLNDQQWIKKFNNIQ